IPRRQLRWFVFCRNATTPGLICESTWTGGQLASIPYSGERFTFRYSTCAGGKWKTWKRSSGGTRGTHGDVMQRIVHVQVTCAKRPIRRRITVGGFAAVYGVNVAITFNRVGSTRCVSATTASFAVIESPNRWTVGVIDAYALNGRPSPTEEPLYTGSAPAP